MENSIDQFVDRLTLEKGLTRLEPEVLAQMKSDLKERVEDKINAVIVEKLPKELLADFEKLLSEDASEKETQKFCQENIPNLDSVLASALLDFRNIYLNL